MSVGTGITRVFEHKLDTTGQSGVLTVTTELTGLGIVSNPQVVWNGSEYAVFWIRDLGAFNEWILSAIIFVPLLGALVLAGAGVAPSYLLWVLALFVWGVCGGAAMTMSRTIMQEQAPARNSRQ